MGCLNSTGEFGHWFGNIHLSGPCNRSCYFCIGQHMMSLDGYDILDRWPLAGLDEFVGRCRSRGINEINLTGTNTDPLLYTQIDQLAHYLRDRVQGLVLGLRTNGAMALARPLAWRLFNKASISIHSFNPTIYKAMMGSGHPPDLAGIMDASQGMDIKLNVVLGPENCEVGDILKTIDHAQAHGIRRVNLREPYGQPHVGDPLERLGWEPTARRLGMPVYRYDPGDIEIMYWDVHYVEVESINLYASGRVSEDYPITRGHDPVGGNVFGQEHWQVSGRQQMQWL